MIIVSVDTDGVAHYIECDDTYVIDSPGDEQEGS